MKNSSPPKGRPPAIISKGRGFNKEDAIKFLIGYAPAGWDSFKTAGQKAGFTPRKKCSPAD